MYSDSNPNSRHVKSRIAAGGIHDLTVGPALPTARLSIFSHTGKKSRPGLLSKQSADAVGENCNLSGNQRVSLTDLIDSHGAADVIAVAAGGKYSQKENVA